MSNIVYVVNGLDSETNVGVFTNMEKVQEILISLTKSNYYVGGLTFAYYNDGVEKVVTDNIEMCYDFIIVDVVEKDTGDIIDTFEITEFVLDEIGPDWQ